MRKTTSLAVVALAATTLAACSGTQSGLSSPMPTGQAPAYHRASAISPALIAKAGASGLIFVADFGNQGVDIYPEGGSKTGLLGTISNGLTGPSSVAVDGSGNLFVVDLPTATVLKYASTLDGGPEMTYHFAAFAQPTDVTVGPDGTVFVAVIADSGTTSILEFPTGSTNPSLTLNVSSENGMTTDASGNLFVSAASNDVEKFARGSTSGTLLGLTGIQNIGAVAIDGSENLIVADMGVQSPAHGGAVDVFPPGSHTASRKIAFNAFSSEGLALDRTNNRIFVGNFQTQGYNKLTVFDLSYPTFQLAKKVPDPTRGAAGIAVSPSDSF